MKRIICLVAFIAFFANAEAQFKIKKSLGDFTDIELSGASRVDLYQSDSNYIVIHSKDSSAKNIHANIRSGMLYITGTFRGEVHAKNIASIRTTDACSLTCKDTLKVDKITLSASDAGKLDILVHATTVVANSDDAGNIKISGTTDLLAAKANDASHLNVFGLKAATVKAISSDGSDEDVWVINNIDAHASDGSTIHIKGAPKDKNTVSTDGSTITMDDSGEEITTENGRHSAGTMLDKDTIFGKKKNDDNAEGFIGMGFVTGGNKNAPIKYLNSREFIIGFGNDSRICNWNRIGMDFYYKSTGYYLAQNKGKIFPDTLMHDAQKVSLQNFGGLIYDRFIFTKGYHGQVALDLGFNFDWTFNTREVSWDNSSDVKTIDRNLVFFHHGNYGVMARLVLARTVSFYCSYRLSNPFKSMPIPAEYTPTLPPFVFGIILGTGNLN